MVQLRVVDVQCGSAEAAELSQQVEEAIAARVPCILRGFDLGQSSSAWSLEQLQRREEPVTAHVSESADLDFVSKNFAYKTLSLGAAVSRAFRPQQPDGEYFFSPTEKYYVRALGDDRRSEPADLRLQFPQLAAALRLPRLFPAEDFFSSVLRVASGGVRLWLHYDVMDNLLCCLRGRKRATLYSPYDAQLLYLRGDKSLVQNPDACDLRRFPRFADATPFVGDLLPGDILHIPAMWFHSVLNLEPTVCVNVFWRRLPRQLYDSKDAYGNKEPVPVARLRQSVAQAMKATEALPHEFRHVYGVQLRDMIAAAMCDARLLQQQSL